MKKKLSVLIILILFLGCEGRQKRQSTELDLERLKTIVSAGANSNSNQGKTAVSTEADNGILIPFYSKGFYGYVNSDLQVVIRPKFEKAGHFTSDGFAIVHIGLVKPAIINIQGDVVKRLSYGTIYHIYGDIYEFDDEEINDFYIIGIKDNRIIAEHAGSYGMTTKEGYIMGIFPYEEKRRCFIDFDGNKVLTHLNMNRPSYSFYDQRARITDEDWDPRIIDMEGNNVGNFSFVSIGQRYSEGLIPAGTADGITGYLDKSGNFAFTVPFVSDNQIPVARNFSGGYAAIKTSNSNWKIINADGQFVSENLLVDYMNEFSDGLSMVLKYNPAIDERKYGYVNTRGEYLIRPILDDADDFKNGYARIEYNGREGLLNTNGKVIWSSDIIKGSPVENELR
jgi:hypothetical protein